MRVALRYIIRDIALKEFTWKGTREKDPFIVFSHINNILKDAIHTAKNPYTDHDHNKYMVEYCKHAPFRFKSSKKKRKPRKTRKVAAELENDESGDDEHDESGDDENHDHESAEDEMSDNENGESNDENNDGEND